MRTVHVPELGDRIPRRGNRLSLAGGELFLSISGWRFEGSVPNVSKAVLIVAPHTSNFDFLVGVAAMFALGFRASFLGKHTLFSWPIGGLMRWLGGIPVDRRTTGGLVEETVGLFESRDSLILAVAPEGTRSNVTRWKTGFYWVALQAGVPIVPIAMDYGRRCVRLGGRFDPTGDIDADFGVLEAFFYESQGRRTR